MSARGGLRIGRVIAWALALSLLAACGGDRGRVRIPVPKLPDGPLELRVAFLVNERLPRPTPAELQTLLDTAAAAMRAHFQREVRFAATEVHPIELYFAKLPSSARATADELIYDFKQGKGDRKRLRKALEADLRKTGDDLGAMIEYARPHLLHPVREKSFDALADALIATQLTRLGALAKETAPDGRPLIDERPYNEVIYWDSLARAPLPYEVILTNQVFASVEYTINSVHSALRGGITNGLTTPNPASRYGTTAIVSTYPMFGADPVTTALRANERYTPHDAARYAGVLLAHELGHELWHLGHPYGRTACVMSPTPLLHFRRWVEALVPTECPIGGEGAMKPGFAKLYTLETK